MLCQVAGKQLGWQTVHCSASQAVKAAWPYAWVGDGVDGAECVRRWQLLSCAMRTYALNLTDSTCASWAPASTRYNGGALPATCLAALQPPAVCCHISREEGMHSSRQARHILQFLVLLAGLAHEPKLRRHRTRQLFVCLAAQPACGAVCLCSRCCLSCCLLPAASRITRLAGLLLGLAELLDARPQPYVLWQPA